jgi:hypothetical protein
MLAPGHPPAQPTKFRVRVYESFRYDLRFLEPLTRVTSRPFGLFFIAEDDRSSGESVFQGVHG